MLVRPINRVGAARYGVNILEDVPPGQVRGPGLTTVAIVAEFPWGPTEQPTSIDPAALFETFAPLEFGLQDSTPSLRAFINKSFPFVEIVRVDPASSATATRTYQGAGPADSVDVTARHSGAAGNLISIEWVANADTPANRDAIVSITPAGATTPTYSETYENVALPGTPITVNDPDDPFVTFVRNGSAAVVPDAAAAAPLQNGADGTAVVADYTDAINTLADANLDWSIAFVAEPPETLIDTINAGILTFDTANQRGVWILCTPAGQTVATARTNVASLTRSIRTVYPYPKVRTVNTFDPNREPVTVQGNAFYAAALAAIAEEQSPGGAVGAPFISGIVGIEPGVSVSDAEYELLNRDGISPFQVTRALGPIIRNGVNTQIANAALSRISRTRLVQFIGSGIASILVRYIEDKLDINLERRELGPVTGPEIESIRAFLQGLVTLNRIAAFSLDPFGANIQSNIAAGEWIILARIQSFPDQVRIVLRLQAGTTVQIDEMAA